MSTPETMCVPVHVVGAEACGGRPRRVAGVGARCGRVAWRAAHGRAGWVRRGKEEAGGARSLGFAALRRLDAVPHASWLAVRHDGPACGGPQRQGGVHTVSADLLEPA